MKPKVSVILPFYNNESTIKRCLLSLVNQDYKNKEIIAVDDGSIDNSLKILKKFKKVKIIPAKHKGRSYARNLGLKIAKGKHVFFAEADAYYSKNYLSSCLNLFSKNPKIGSVAGHLLVWNKNKFLPKCKEIEREYALKTRKPKAGWFFRRELLKNRFDARLHFAEDVNLATEILRRGYSIEWCKQAKWYHMEPETLSEECSRNFEMGKNIIRIFRANKKVGLSEIFKATYFPSVLVTGVLSIFFNQILFLFVFLLTAFLLRVIKFSFVSLKLGYDIMHILFVPIVWMVRSFARFLGMLLSK